MKLRYSGNKSKKFWSRINNLPRTRDKDLLYQLGCDLQTLEGLVFRILKEEEDKVPAKKIKKRKVENKER